MSSSTAPMVSPEERRYHLATAMMSTALDFGRDDVESWWAAFLPSFIMWINAVYDAWLSGRRLKFSIPKIRSIESAIVMFLPRMTPEDRKRWWSIHQAVTEEHSSQASQGLLTESVQVGMVSLPVSDLEEVAGVSGDEEQIEDAEVVETPGVRCSERKAEKARIVDQYAGEDEVSDFGDVDKMGMLDDRGGAPREKVHKGYTPYDINRHFFWGKPCEYCVEGNWTCFGDVYLVSGKLSTQTKCQTCAIIRKPCKGGFCKPSNVSTTPSLDPIYHRPYVPSESPVRARRQSSKVKTSSSGSAPVGAIYDSSGASIGQISKGPLVDLANPPLVRKRSALAPPSSADPPSSKSLRSVHSASAINRTSSAMSTATSVPSPLVSSTSLPGQMEVDALEFAIERGNLDDARRRIRALRVLRQQERGYPVN